MTGKDSNALVVRATSGLQATGQGPKGILSGMVVDALALARHSGKELVAARFPLGEYEFCEPDYRQILLWAQALGLEPEEVIHRLENPSPDSLEKEPIGFHVDNGAIVSLLWNFELLPLAIFECLEGLVITELGFKGYSPVTPQLSLRLPMLTWLLCRSIGLTTLDLSNMPNLFCVMCACNQLTKLDLSAVPELAYLECDDNQLIELDLSSATYLTILSCSGNQLSKLNISLVAELHCLKCDDNQITELEIRHLSKLTEFYADSTVTVQKRPDQKNIHV